jgi:hypothetical protein
MNIPDCDWTIVPPVPTTSNKNLNKVRSSILPGVLSFSVEKSRAYSLPRVARPQLIFSASPTTENRPYCSREKI